jgi:hypothetical protein
MGSPELSATSVAPCTTCTGPDGDADTKPDPDSATTAGKPRSHDHEVRLEY